MRTSITLLVLLFSLLITLSQVSAEVVVFDNYQTTYSLEDGKILVQKEIRLKNVGDNPIIPGEIHFKLSKLVSGGDREESIGASEFVVKNKFDQRLDTKIVPGTDFTDLVFTIWDPLLPQFYYDVTMTYWLDFKPRGILFYGIDIPAEHTTIPRKVETTSFVLPKKYHVTFAPDALVSSEGSSTLLEWGPTERLSFEYSIIPFFRNDKIRAVNIFWLIVIVLVLGKTVFTFRKKGAE
ncbi:MAG: hypothetical protein H6502_01050 [Candidatus Woesearchaeota archaeon]|nr:MAG: hypothetical protein H6502_01050 [Candidatus Woesearchaeota archaeon]